MKNNYDTATKTAQWVLIPKQLNLVLITVCVTQREQPCYRGDVEKGNSKHYDCSPGYVDGRQKDGDTIMSTRVSQNQRAVLGSAAIVSQKASQVLPSKVSLLTAYQW